MSIVEEIKQNFIASYPPITSSRFQQELFNKREFHDLDSASVLLDRQQQIGRYLSNNTPYRELFVFDKVGTGKTCVAYAVTNQTVFTKKVILAKGTDSLNALVQTFVQTCDPVLRRELSKQMKGQPKEKQLYYMKRILQKHRYTFHTFETFAKQIAALPEHVRINAYNDTVFVVDEVHNIPLESDTYAQLYQLFHQIPRRTILLLSATPMKDNVSEIATIMNLVLPTPLPTRREFETYYFKNGVVQHESELFQHFAGRIAYFNPPDTSSIELVYHGSQVIPQDIPEFRVVQLEMSAYQSEQFFIAQLEEATSSDLFIESRKYALSAPFPSDTTFSSIEAVAKYSIKFATVLEDITTHSGNVFVYCSFVSRGILPFVQILKQFGYSECKGNEPNQGKRFAIMTSQTQHIDRVIQYFNDPRNKNGAYCKVILGSRKISETYTFRNVTRLHMMTLHWNATETTQVVGRINRYGSHRDLPQPSRIDIFQYSCCDLDLRMNLISFQKDVNIKRMEWVCRKTAWDCPLVYDKNKPLDSAQDFSRECGYEPCVYTCATADTPPRQTKDDVGTFQIYYSSEVDEKLYQQILSVFQTHSSISYNALYATTQPLSHFQLLRVLNYIISNHVPIPQGDRSFYLTEVYNQYRLVDDITLTRPNAYPELAVEQPQKLFVHVRSLADILFETELDILKSAPFGVLQARQLGIPTQMRFLTAWKETTPRAKWVEDAFKEWMLYNDQVLYGFQLPNQPVVYFGEFKEEAEQVVETKSDFIGIEGHTGKFCIRDLRQEQQSDKRKTRAGAVCEESGWKRQALIDICLHYKIPIQNLEKQTKRQLCEILQKWFKDNGLLTRGVCGTSRRTKR